MIATTPTEGMRPFCEYYIYRKLLISPTEFKQFVSLKVGVFGVVERGIRFELILVLMMQSDIELIL